MQGVHFQTLLQFAIPACALTFVYYTLRTKIPMVPTQEAAGAAMIETMRDDINARENKQIVIYDLGSGAGGLCLRAGAAFPEATIIGYEMAWPAWLFAVLRQKLSRQKNVHFKFGNFWSRNISDGDIILFYLGDVVMAQMAKKLQSEPKANRLILSNTFPLPKEWKPTTCLAIQAAVSKKIFVYRQGGKFGCGGAILHKY